MCEFCSIMNTKNNQIQSGAYVPPVIEIYPPLLTETPILVGSRQLESMGNVDPYSGIDPFI